MNPFRPKVLLHQGHSHHGSHGGGGSADDSRASRNRLLICFALTASFMLVEAATGLWTNSLALLSDAFHMLSDATALGLAALAARVSLRRPTPEKTFGFKRFEVLAAFANGIVLVLLGLGTGVNAVMRLWHPQGVTVGPMLIVAAAGLVLNLAMLAWLHLAGEEKNLNEEGVLWHVLGDALGSVAALASGALILWKGWLRADSIASLLIAIVFILGAVRLLRQSSHILVEGVPEGVEIQDVRALMLSVPQIGEVHDLHLWTLNGRDLYLSAHVGVETGTRPEPEVTADLRRRLEERFGVHHLTLQTGLCGPEDCGNGRAH